MFKRRPQDVGDGLQEVLIVVGKLGAPGRPTSIPFLCADNFYQATALVGGCRLSLGEDRLAVMLPCRRKRGTNSLSCATFTTRSVVGAAREAQHRPNVGLESLPTSTSMSYENLYGIDGQWHQDVEERLQDKTITPVPDQAQFRIDFPAWLKTRMTRERRIIKTTMRNEQTKDLSKEFEVSPSRISQVRQLFKEGWKILRRRQGGGGPGGWRQG